MGTCLETGMSLLGMNAKNVLKTNNAHKKFYRSYRKETEEAVKVFLCETIHPKAYQLLAEHAQILPSWDQCGEADALINRALMIGPEEMDRMPDLKVIAVHGTGTDGVDLAEAARRGIRTVYAPHLNANAVAEMNVALLLAAVRKIVRADHMIRMDSLEDGKDVTTRMAEAQAALRGMELRGKTAGILGFGAIGTKTAHILRDGFGMKCMTWTPRMTPERAQSHGCIAAQSVEELLSSSDVVLLSFPLTPEYMDFMNQKRIGMMKEGSVLINASRGGLVDENALLENLQNGHLAAAACDVMKADYPQRDNPLLALPNFIATPHIGANTEEALYEVGMVCVRQILDVMEGREPEYPVY